MRMLNACLISFWLMLLLLCCLDVKIFPDFVAPVRKKCISRVQAYYMHMCIVYQYTILRFTDRKKIGFTFADKID